MLERYVQVIIPCVILVLSCLLLDENLTFAKFVGLALVIFGVILVEMS